MLELYFTKKQKDFEIGEELELGEFYPSHKPRVLSNLLFTSNPGTILEIKNRCGMSADFIAAFFSVSPYKDSNKKDESYFQISRVSYELLQNSHKFGKEDGPIQTEILEYEKGISIETSHSASKEQCLVYKKNLEEIFSISEKEAELQKRLDLRNNSLNISKKGLGLLHLLHSYSAILGVRFRAVSESECIVNTRAFLKWE